MQKTILISGCSSGIGLEACQILRKRGHQVIASARKHQDVEKLRDNNFDAIRLDVADSESIDNAVRTAIEMTNGRIDALFNNAGFGIPGAVEDLSRTALRDQFETNVFGAFELINKVLPIMRRQGYGRIIQNSSVLRIRRPSPFAVHTMRVNLHWKD